MRLSTKSRDPKGQTLVIVGVGMIVLVGMVGLVIDVGLQWGDNRGSQNASDASAEAGAIVLMEYMLGATHDDADVLVAVEDAAAAGDNKNQSTTVSVNLAGVKTVRVRCKSTVAGDDPVFYGSSVRLVR